MPSPIGGATQEPGCIVGSTGAQSPFLSYGLFFPPTAHLAGSSGSDVSKGVVTGARLCRTIVTLSRRAAPRDRTEKGLGPGPGGGGGTQPSQIALSCSGAVGSASLTAAPFDDYNLREGCGDHQGAMLQRPVTSQRTGGVAGTEAEAYMAFGFPGRPQQAARVKHGDRWLLDISSIF